VENERAGWGGILEHPEVGGASIWTLRRLGYSKRWHDFPIWSMLTGEGVFDAVWLSELLRMGVEAFEAELDTVFFNPDARLGYGAVLDEPVAWFSVGADGAVACLARAPVRLAKRRVPAWPPDRQWSSAHPMDDPPSFPVDFVLSNDPFQLMERVGGRFHAGDGVWWRGPVELADDAVDWLQEDVRVPHVRAPHVLEVVRVADGRLHRTLYFADLHLDASFADGSTCPSLLRVHGVFERAG